MIKHLLYISLMLALTVAVAWGAMYLLPWYLGDVLVN